MPTPSNDAGEALAAGQHLIASVHVTQRAEPPSLLLIEAPFRLLPGSDTGLGWPLDGAMWTNLRPGPRPPFRHATYQLDESEVEELRTLWGILASLNTAALRFVASILRRFTFAFDRFSAADRIVDLLVAAESLFLHDAVDPQQKMELRFRLAVRAGKFVEHPAYTQREVYTLMRHAYGARSAVVHGPSRKGPSPE